MTEEQNAPTFEALGLRPELLATLATLGYEAPTPIQEKTIPVLLDGRDLIGQAQTGTGKTAAFALPILQKIDTADRSTQALVLAPTRELAMQVAEAFHSYARAMGPVSVLPVYGGAPIMLQLRHLERGAQIVVGTPGRLIDHLERGTLKLGAVKTVVLDEADEMLRMGFIDDVETILSKVKTPRQTALFSATMPQPIQRIAERHLTDPVKIEIEHRTLAAPAIEQRYLNVSEPQKLDVLVKLLELEESEATLVFRRTKTGAAELAEKLEARGFAAQAMHGDMTQALRESVIRRLKAGQIEIVVATDVAARGLDVEQIAHVVNYDIPHDEEVYVHRIGRTGRAGRSGVATLFVTPRERRMLRDIERFTGGRIDTMKMPTRADVHAKRIAVFKDSVRKAIDEGDLDLYVALVTEIAEESGRDVTEVAAAAARLANASRSLQLEAVDERREPEVRPEARDQKSKQAGRAAKEELKWSRPQPRSDERREGGKAVPSAPEWREAMGAWPEEGAAPPRERFGALPRERAPRPARPVHGGASEPKVRLVIALGSEHGLTAKNVVGSIANEADVPGRDIGPIEIGETSTIVVVPEAVADRVIAKCADSRIKGKAFRIRREGSTEVQNQRSKHADEAPEAAGRAQGAADSFEWTPTAGERLRKKLRRDDEAPPEGDARTRDENQQSRPPGHKPFYERFKATGDDTSGGAPPKKPFRRAGEAGAKPAGDRPYRPRPAEGGAPPFRKTYDKPPFRKDRDAGAKPYGGKPFRARTDEGGAPPFKREYEKKPFRKDEPGAKPYGEKPYAKRAAAGGAPPRGKSFGSKKRFDGDKGGSSKPAGKKPFYDAVKGSKFRKKPK